MRWTSGKNLVFSAVLVFTSLLTSLWLVELGLRLYFHGAVFPVAVETAGQIVHPTRGAAHRPNSVSGMLQLSFAATARINSRGMRGAEFDIVPKPGITRIMFVSDSNVFGSGVNDGETLPDRMQAILGRDRYEIINLSVGAYSNVQQYVWLVEEGLSYKPEMVIFCFTPSNDIQTNYYPLQALFQRVSKRPYAVSDGKGGFTIDNSHMLAYAEEAKKVNLLHVMRDFFAGPMVKRVVEQAIEATTGGRKTDPNIWIGWPYLSEYSIADAEAGRTADYYDKLWTEAWDITKAVIRGMRDKTEATGAKFVMYPFVSKMQGNPDHLARVKAALPNLKLDMEKPEREMRKFSNESGIPMISMYDAVTRAAQAGDRNIYFGPDDDHMTAHGYQISAEALLADLWAQGLLTNP